MFKKFLDNPFAILGIFVLGLFTLLNTCLSNMLQKRDKLNGNYERAISSLEKLIKPRILRQPCKEIPSYIPNIPGAITYSIVPKKESIKYYYDTLL